MKRYSKGHVDFLYCGRKVENGGAWQTTQLLGHIIPKKLTPIIRFIDISLLHVELGVTSWFLTGCLVNMLLSPC